MTDRDAPRSDSPADPPPWGQGPAGGWGAPRQPSTEEPTQVWPQGWPSAGRAPAGDEQTVQHDRGAADDATVARGTPPGEDRTVAWAPGGPSAAPDPGRTAAWSLADDDDDRPVAAAPSATSGDRTVAWSPADDDRTAAAPASGGDRTVAYEPASADADRTEAWQPRPRTASPLDDDRTVATSPPAAGENRAVAPGEDPTVAWPTASGGRAGIPSPAPAPGWAGAPPWPGPGRADAFLPSGADGDRTQQVDQAAPRTVPERAGPPQQQQPGWGAPPPPPAPWSPAWNGPAPPPPPPLPDGPTLPRRGRLPWILGALALLVIVAALVLAFVAPGFLVTRVFDRVAVQKGVTQILTDSYQLPGVSAVTCPENVKVQQGDTFTCDATIGGEPKKVPIRITSNSGDYEVQRPQ